MTIQLRELSILFLTLMVALYLQIRTEIGYVGDSTGNITAMRLSDSSVVNDFPRDANTTDSDPILQSVLISTVSFGPFPNAS